MLVMFHFVSKILLEMNVIGIKLSEKLLYRNGLQQLFVNAIKLRFWWSYIVLCDFRNLEAYNSYNLDIYEALF